MLQRATVALSVAAEASRVFLCVWASTCAIAAGLAARRVHSQLLLALVCYDIAIVEEVLLEVETN